jgi:hypothetical protein
MDALFDLSLAGPLLEEQELAPREQDWFSNVNKQDEGLAGLLACAVASQGGGFDLEDQQARRRARSSGRSSSDHASLPSHRGSDSGAMEEFFQAMGLLPAPLGPRPLDRSTTAPPDLQV